jgi:hypothetical protein
MPKLSNRPPKYSKLKKYAVVYLHDKIHYLGLYGSEESKVAYARFIAETAATSTLCELSHELQLTAYAYLFREATGQEELRCEIRQLIKTKTPKIMTHRFPRRTDEHFARFFGLIREYVDALEKGIYNYRPSWTCGTMCEHYTACAC